MKPKWVNWKQKVFISAIGALLAAACGLFFLLTPFGDALTDASYDYLFRFGVQPITNNVALIVMDNAAFDRFYQVRGQPWDRELHAQLLNRLADDGCSLVVMDSFFREPRDARVDELLAKAMKRQHRIVLMAEQSQVTHPGLEGAQPTLPAGIFLNAAGTNWGVGWLNPDLDFCVRRHWPFPSPGPYPSLSWAAAVQAGAWLGSEPQERWLRYYGPHGEWACMSYQYALTQPAGYFQNRLVFIGTQPKTSLPDGEIDKFCTPYTRWTGEVSSGVEIQLTAFLNLLNGDSLKRPTAPVEWLIFIAFGFLAGGGLCRLPIKPALAAASGAMLVGGLAAISLSYFTNYWFPWLIVLLGQIPVALIWAVAMNRRLAAWDRPLLSMDSPPRTPGYKLVNPPFGQGAYGKVWLGRNRAGKWCALKAVYLSRFEHNPDPYEREYSGVLKYQPISDRHPGLLRVDFVSEKQDGYFYYIMELGDSLKPGWEKNPALYAPHDLVSGRTGLENKRLPIKECLRIGIILSEALDFLHGQGMTHRDIKPQNIIFVNGQPKLADVGLMTDIRMDDPERTLVGTPGYMPPPPERPGTPQADIYALGMVLYVLSTGKSPGLFPEISTTLVSAKQPEHFMAFNAIVLKACQPDPASRYSTASQLRDALKEADGKIP